MTNFGKVWIFFQNGKMRSVLLAAVLLITSRVSARPEYAVRYGINRCTACHYSPAGGGPRNLNGKYFGAFGFKNESWLQQQDYAGAEVKMLYYRPERTSQVKDGLGLMNGSAWASLPLQKLSEESSEIRVVAEQNLGGFAPGPRQWYARVTFADDTKTTWYPQYLLIGRIIPAFGAMTDEHRTYVRMQSGTAWNVGFDTGVMASANPIESIHYDLAIVDGQKNSGQALAQDMADTWGSIANLRWSPVSLPLALGVSASWYAATQQASAATAVSVYSLISFHRMTRNTVPVTLTAEFVQAKNWNDSFSSQFVNDPAYASTVSASTSKGFYALLDYELTRRFSLQYKYDQLVLDRRFPSDAFQRHGLGIKHYFANNMWMILRYEKALTGHPGENGGLKLGDLNAVWGLLSLSI